MRIFRLILLLSGLGMASAPAQDVLYLTDKARVEGNLLSLSRERISIDVRKGDSFVKFSYGLDRVLLVVNRKGHFVCPDQLWSMPTEKRNRAIDQFMAASESLPHDMLIRDRPTEVVYGTVKSNQGAVITYTSLKGKSATVPKTDLIGVFYRNGRHELFAPALDVCDKIDQMGGTLPPAVAATPVATAKPKTTPPATRPVAERPAKKTRVATRSVPPAEPVQAVPVADEPEPIADVPAPPEPVSPASAAPAAQPAGATLKLTDAQYEEYRQQALQRVEEFGVLLGVVADKTTETIQKDKAIDQIMSMFKPGATIQISSTTPGKEPLSLRMRDYLIRLKLLPYKSVTLEWTDIQYVQELTQKDDGNYYGKIRGEQRFSGLSQKGTVQYGDLTEKDVDVMLTPYKKQTEGEDLRKWAVLLGNVGVVATQ